MTEVPLGNPRPRLGGFEHPLAIIAVCGSSLAVSYAVAVKSPVPELELELTEWINSAPGWIASGSYPVMQSGTLGGPMVAAAGIAILGKDRLLAGATAVVGVTTWFLAKGVKAVVERGRPAEYLPEIEIREGDGTGLGYVSGHSAVAAATAVMVMAAVPRRYRPIPALLAGIVGLARIVHGVHLPADVVGGWAMGTLVALFGLHVVDVIDRRSREAGSPSPFSSTPEPS